MALESELVSVGTSPTALNVAEGVGSVGLVVKVPTGGADVFLGGSAVDTTDGFLLAAGESLAIDLEPNEVAYGVVAAATQNVNVIRRGVG